MELRSAPSGCVKVATSSSGTVVITFARTRGSALELSVGQSRGGGQEHKDRRERERERKAGHERTSVAWGVGQETGATARS